MFHWLVDEQLSTYQIVKRLNESGHRTRRGNARWAGGTVYNILRNAVYAGRYCYNGRIQQPAQRKNMPVDQPRKHGPHSRTLRPPEEWITVCDH